MEKELEFSFSSFFCEFDRAVIIDVLSVDNSMIPQGQLEKNPFFNSSGN